ncbi:MAG: hypothetical protein ABH814_01290 [bacterium]
MRNQLLIITTILVVGTAFISALGFYALPREEPENSNIAGIATKAPLSPQIPLLPNCEVLSHSKTALSSQITCLVKNGTLFETVKEHEKLTAQEGWEETNSKINGDIFEISARKGKSTLETKAFSDSNLQTLLVISYTP